MGREREGSFASSAGAATAGHAPQADGSLGNAMLDRREVMTPSTSHSEHIDRTSHLGHDDQADQTPDTSMSGRSGYEEMLGDHADGGQTSNSLSTHETGEDRTMGRDEMMLTLLAGQAAVDCEQLPVGGWEEVEGWKKVCWQLLSCSCHGTDSAGTFAALESSVIARSETSTRS